MKKVLTAIFSLTLASSAAFAETGRPDTGAVERYKSMFDQLDVDGSGALSVAEAAAAGLTSEDFQRLDEDGNGELSREEFIVQANDPEATEGYNPDATHGHDMETNPRSDTETGTGPAQGPTQ